MASSFKCLAALRNDGKENGHPSSAKSEGDAFCGTYQYYPSILPFNGLGRRKGSGISVFWRTEIDIVRKTQRTFVCLPGAKLHASVGRLNLMCSGGLQNLGPFVKDTGVGPTNSNG